MGRRTPGRRVPPRRPDGRRVPPPPGRPEPRRPDPRRPEPRTTPSLGAIGPAVIAAAKDKGRVEGKGIAPKPGSFESMLNALEQQKKEAQAKTGSSALSPKQIAETMVDERIKGGLEPFDGAMFRGTLENLQKMKEAKRSGSENVDSPFSQERFEKFKEGFRPKTDSGDTSSLAGITKAGPPEFDGDAFRAKLEELQRKKEEGNRGKGIRGGSRPVRRTGGKPRTFRRTGGRPAPFFSPRPTRPPVRYGVGGPFGAPTFFDSRPSRPAPFFTPRPTRPPVRYGMRPGGIFGPMFGAIERGLGRR